MLEKRKNFLDCSSKENEQRDAPTIHVFHQKINSNQWENVLKSFFSVSFQILLCIVWWKCNLGFNNVAASTAAAAPAWLGKSFSNKILVPLEGLFNFHAFATVAQQPFKHDKMGIDTPLHWFPIFNKVLKSLNCWKGPTIFIRVQFWWRWWWCKQLSELLFSITHLQWRWPWRPNNTSKLK